MPDVASDGTLSTALPRPRPASALGTMSHNPKVPFREGPPPNALAGNFDVRKLDQDLLLPGGKGTKRLALRPGEAAIDGQIEGPLIVKSGARPSSADFRLRPASARPASGTSSPLLLYFGYRS